MTRRRISLELECERHSIVLSCQSGMVYKWLASTVLFCIDATQCLCLVVEKYTRIQVSSLPLKFLQKYSDIAKYYFNLKITFSI